MMLVQPSREAKKIFFINKALQRRFPGNRSWVYHLVMLEGEERSTRPRR
jgi:hypothetical protein